MLYTSKYLYKSIYVVCHIQLIASCALFAPINLGAKGRLIRVATNEISLVREK